MVGGRVKLVELVTLYSDTSYSTDVMISEFFLIGQYIFVNPHEFASHSGGSLRVGTVFANGSWVPY